jgi:hypothetical protein
MSSDDINSLPPLPDADVFDFNGSEEAASDDVKSPSDAADAFGLTGSDAPRSIDAAFENIEPARAPPPPPLLRVTPTVPQPQAAPRAALHTAPWDSGVNSSFLSSVILTAATQLTDASDDSNSASTLDRVGLYHQLCGHTEFIGMLDTTSPTARLDRTRLEIPALRFEPSPDWLIHASRAQTLWLERLNAFYHLSMTPAVRMGTVSTDDSSDPQEPELDCRREFAQSSALAQQGVEALASPSSSPSSSVQLVASPASPSTPRAMSLHELYTTVLLPGTLHAFDAKLRSMDREFKGNSSLCLLFH